MLWVEKRISNVQFIYIYACAVAGRIHENETLFTYITGKNYTFYNPLDVEKPAFLSEVNETAYMLEHCPAGFTFDSSKCNTTACIVDTIATCNAAIGLASQATETDNEEQAKQLGKNECPLL